MTHEVTDDAADVTPGDFLFGTTDDVPGDFVDDVTEQAADDPNDEAVVLESPLPERRPDRPIVASFT